MSVFLQCILAVGRTVDAQKFMDLLRSVESSATLAINSYAGEGPGFIGRDLLDELEFNGIAQGEQPIYLLTAASQFLERNKTLEQAEKMWGAS